MEISTSNASQATHAKGFAQRILSAHPDDLDRICQVIFSNDSVSTHLLGPLASDVNRLGAHTVQARSVLRENRSRSLKWLYNAAKAMTILTAVPLAAFHIRSAYRGIDLYGLKGYWARSCTGLLTDGLIVGGMWSIAKIGEVREQAKLGLFPDPLFVALSHDAEQLESRFSKLPLYFDDPQMVSMQTGEGKIEVELGSFCRDFIRAAFDSLKMEELAGYLPKFSSLLKTFQSHSTLPQSEGGKVVGRTFCNG